MGTNEVKVDRALIQRALTAFGAQCGRMASCSECAFEGFGDCKMAFLMDYLAEHGHSMAAEPAADDRLGRLREEVVRSMAEARGRYEQLIVECPETLDEECLKMCKMNRAHGVISTLEQVLEEIDVLRQDGDAEPTEGGEA